MENRIIKIVSDHFDVSEEEMKSKSRKLEIVEARHYAMTMLRRNTPMSTIKIGKVFHRDHATVLHAIKTVTNNVSLYIKDRDTMNLLTGRINGTPALKEYLPEEFFMENDYFIPDIKERVEELTEDVIEEFNEEFEEFKYEKFVSPFSDHQQRSTHYQEYIR